MCLRGNLYLPVGLKYELAARAYVYIQHVQRQSDRWPQICVRSCEVIIRLRILFVFFSCTNGTVYCRMITHAKVRYEDDRKLAIVDVGDIENFKPEHAKDFKSKFFYSVKWTDPDGTSDYYRARILALGGKLFVCDPGTHLFCLVKFNIKCIFVFRGAHMPIVDAIRCVRSVGRYNLINET